MWESEAVLVAHQGEDQFSEWGNIMDGLRRPWSLFAYRPSGRSGWIAVSDHTDDLEALIRGLVATYGPDTEVLFDIPRDIGVDELSELLEAEVLS